MNSDNSSHVVVTKNQGTITAESAIEAPSAAAAASSTISTSTIPIPNETTSTTNQITSTVTSNVIPSVTNYAFQQFDTTNTMSAYYQQYYPGYYAYASAAAAAAAAAASASSSSGQALTTPYQYFTGSTIPGTYIASNTATYSIPSTSVTRNNSNKNEQKHQHQQQQQDEDDGDDDDPTIAKPNKPKLSNTLNYRNCDKKMGLNPLIYTNILQSPYFKNNLFELKTYNEVIDEIFYNVKHLEPWEKGSRKVSGQTGMCGSVRGVGAGGIISTPFCILYKLYTLKLTRKQVISMIKHKDSPYIRALGFMYIRFTQPPQDLWQWFKPYLQDEEEIDPKAGGGPIMTIGEMVRHILTKLEWYSTLFPRIPRHIQMDIEKKLEEYDREQESNNGKVKNSNNSNNNNSNNNNKWQQTSATNKKSKDNQDDEYEDGEVKDDIENVNTYDDRNNRNDRNDRIRSSDYSRSKQHYYHGRSSNRTSSHHSSRRRSRSRSRSQSPRHRTSSKKVKSSSSDQRRSTRY